MSENSKKTVLLTGGTGFLGKRFREELVRKGYHVVATCTRNPLARPEADVTWIKANFAEDEARDPAFWNKVFEEHKIDFVIHNAGIIEENKKSNATFDNVNFQSTKALADAAESSAQIGKFILISTMGAAHDFSHKYGYPGSKRKAEDYLRGKDKLNWTIVRPDVVYSGNSWGHDFSFDELSGLPVVPIIGSGKQKLQPIHLDDLAQTVNLLDNGKANREILHAAGSDAVEIRELFRFFKNKRHQTYREIPVALSLAEAFAKNYPMGVFNASFIGMLRELTAKPFDGVDAKPFMEAVGLEKQISLQETYAEGRPVKFPRLPLMQMFKQVLSRPLRLFSFAKDFAKAALKPQKSAPRLPAPKKPAQLPEHK